MRELDLSSLGLAPIRGDDVEGGLGPFTVPLTVLVVGAIISNWTEIKKGLSDGWASV